MYLLFCINFFSILSKSVYKSEIKQENNENKRSLVDGWFFRTLLRLSARIKSTISLQSNIINPQLLPILLFQKTNAVLQNGIQYSFWILSCENTELYQTRHYCISKLSLPARKLNAPRDTRKLNQSRDTRRWKIHKLRSLLRKLIEFSWFNKSFTRIFCRTSEKLIQQTFI